MKNKPRRDDNANVIKDYLILILIAAIGMIITINVFFRIYYVSRQSIINMWSSKTMVLSQDIEHYLEIPRNAVLFASEGVNLHRKGKDVLSFGYVVVEQRREAYPIFDEQVRGLGDGHGGV